MNDKEELPEVFYKLTTESKSEIYSVKDKTSKAALVTLHKIKELMKEDR